jgi:hypothetical protein
MKIKPNDLSIQILNKEVEFQATAKPMCKSNNEVKPDDINAFNLCEDAKINALILNK